MCGGRGGVCGVGAEGRADVRAGRRARLTPVPARLSATTPPPPPRGGDSRGPEHGRTDGRAAQCMAALAGRRRATAHEDHAASILPTLPRCN